MSHIVISQDYAWVILAAAAMSLQLLFTGFSVGSARKKFNIPYPDMGSGRHAARLSDSDWTVFNNVQRSHLNYVEAFGPAQSLLLLSGLFHPRLSATAGAVYIAGRFAFAIGYRTRGPGGRMAGGIVSNMAMLTMLGTVVHGAFSKLGYC